MLDQRFQEDFEAQARCADSTIHGRGGCWHMQDSDPLEIFEKSTLLQNLAMEVTADLTVLRCCC